MAKVIRCLEPISYEDSLGELGLYSLRKEGSREIFQFFEGVVRKTDTLYQYFFCQKEQQFLTKKKGRFRLEVRKTFFSAAYSGWERLSIETVNISSLEAFKAMLDKTLSHLTKRIMPPGQGLWRSWSSNVSFNPNHSIILQFFYCRILNHNQQKFSTII